MTYRFGDTGKAEVPNPLGGIHLPLTRDRKSP